MRRAQIDSRDLISDQQIGMRLRVRRLERGMSQTQLGNAVGVSFQQIQKYEKGNNSMHAIMIQAIAKVLEVEPEYFFNNAGGHRQQRERQNLQIAALATPGAVRLLDAYGKLQNGARRVIVDLADRLLELK